jgi:aldose sugar dehydrogenase
MPPRGLALVLLACLANSGCGSSPTPSPNPAPAGFNVTTGNEHVGWNQQAADNDTLGTFHYAAYVDGTRFELTEVSCGTTPGPSGFDCSSRLPPMSQGVHTMELAAFVVVNDAALESPHSSAIRVNVLKAVLAGGSAPSRRPPVTSNDQLLVTAVDQLFLTTVDRPQLRVELVTGGLGEPTDMGFAPDGRIFVTERSGGVRVVQENRLQMDPAVQLDDVAVANGGGLVAMAVDPQFSNTHFIYLMYTTRSRRDVLTFRLARFREVLGTLGERAILLDGVPANQGAHAVLRFGTDGKLYAAFDDGGRADLRENLSSFNGKILRLNADATTPGDSASATPIYAYGFESPRGLDWQPATGRLWLADGAGGTDAAGLHQILSSGNSAIRGSIQRSYPLPSASDTTGMVFYQGAGLPSFGGDLLIATERGQNILRVRFDGNVPPNIIATEQLLQNRIGPVRAVGIGRHGEIYFATNDTVAKLVPR